MSTSTKVIQAFVKGAAITMGSTIISCTLAIQVEKTGHRFLFWMKPELYANVDQAFGLTEAQLMSARRRKPELKDSASRMENKVTLDHSTVDIIGDETNNDKRTKVLTKGEWNTFQKEIWLEGSVGSSEVQKTSKNSNYQSSQLEISNQDVFACSMTA